MPASQRLQRRRHAAAHALRRLLVQRGWLELLPRDLLVQQHVPPGQLAPQLRWRLGQHLLGGEVGRWWWCWRGCMAARVQAAGTLAALRDTRAYAALGRAAWKHASNGAAVRGGPAGRARTASLYGSQLARNQRRRNSLSMFWGSSPCGVGGYACLHRWRHTLRGSSHHSQHPPNLLLISLACPRPPTWACRCSYVSASQ